MKQKASPADVPVYLFKQGNNFESQRFFGAHFENVGETEGVMFRVWAPRAKAVSVVGDFNSWIPSATLPDKISQLCRFMFSGRP